MPYVIDSNKNGQFFVRMDAEPDFIHGLTMAPAEREEILNEGDWIVLSFAVWNSHDRPAIDTAIEVVKSMNGRVRLGIRPFEIADEFSSWCPYQPPNAELVIQEKEDAEQVNIAITAASGTSPIWLFIRDGVIVQSHLGHLAVEQLKALSDESLGDAN